MPWKKNELKTNNKLYTSKQNDSKYQEMHTKKGNRPIIRDMALNFIVLYHWN